MSADRAGDHTMPNSRLVQRLADGYTVTRGTVVQKPRFGLYIEGAHADVTLRETGRFADDNGIGFRDGSAHLVNYGSISGRTRFGVTLDSGGSVVNMDGAMIAGAAWGVFVGGPGSISNCPGATIMGSAATLGGHPNGGGGVYLRVGNLANAGIISGGSGGGGNANGFSGSVGVELAITGHLTNAGQILGGTGGSGGKSGGTGGVGIAAGPGGNSGETGIMSPGHAGRGEISSGNAAATGVSPAVIVTNSGCILGGAGGAGATIGGTGGVGVDLVITGDVMNFGALLGGNGGYGRQTGGDGGPGVVISSGTLSNYGSIQGGMGYAASPVNARDLVGGTGGVGADIKGGTLTNAGLIWGGGGGYAKIVAGVMVIGAGGNGVDVAAGCAINNLQGALIYGGNSYFASNGDSGGIGVDLAAGATLTNGGTIRAGEGYSGTASAGVSAQSDAVYNTGTIVGGYNGSSGGSGVYLNGGTLTNSGAVSGGACADGKAGTGAVLLSGATVTNSGTIMGGRALFGYGGAGAYASTGSTLINFGTVNGFSAGGLQGGIGVILDGGALINPGTICGGATVNTPSAGVFETAAAITNSGTVRGGYGFAKNGGAGAWLNGGQLTNSGAVLGGSAFDGAGGAGVYLNGGTLVTSGSILGGVNLRTGVVSDAVQFGGAAGTLMVDPGAVFGGIVMADAAVNDVLVLAGNTPGELSGLGSVFIGFSTISEDAGSSWTLGGANALDTVSQLSVGGALDIAGTLTGTSTACIARQGCLQLDTGATAQFGAVTLTGGTLGGGHGAVLEVGGTRSGAVAGTIAILGGGRVQGFGKIQGAPVSDRGAIVAAGGTLTLSTATSGSGLVTIDPGSTLLAESALRVSDVVFAAGGGTLALAVPAAVTASISGFGAGDIIDLRNITATSLKFIGGALTIEDGKTVIATLAFAGTYNIGNFWLGPDGHGGTAIDFLANAMGLPDYTHTPRSLTHGPGSAGLEESRSGLDVFASLTGQPIAGLHFDIHQHLSY